MKARDAHTALDVTADPNDMVPVPFRSGTPGVLDIKKLNAALLAKPGTNMGPAVDGAEFALQMLRFPYRQVFGDPSVHAAPPLVDVFRPTISMQDAGQDLHPGLDTMAALRPRNDRARRCRRRAGARSRARASRSTPSAASTRRCCATRACSCRSTCRRSSFRPAAPSRWCACRSRSPRPTTRRRRRRPTSSPTARRAPPASICTGRCPTRCCAARSPTTAPTQPARAAARCPTAGSCCAFVVPRGASAPVVRGWVIEADTTPRRRARPVARRRRRGRADRPHGAARRAHRHRAAARSTGPAPTTRRSTASRCHDPLDDLAQVAPNGSEGDQLAYLVAGWWSAPARDPLDGAQTDTSLHERLRQLGWALTEDREDDEKQQRERRVVQDKQASIGLVAATRYAPAAALAARAPLAASAASQVARPGLQFATAAFVDKASAVIQSEPHWPRSALLHGSLYGVPVGALAGVDQRPNAHDVQLVWGEHGDDVAATLASTALAPDDAIGAARLRAAARGVHRQPRRPHRQRRRRGRGRGMGARRRLREPARRRRRHRSPARRRRRRRRSRPGARRAARSRAPPRRRRRARRA